MLRILNEGTVDLSFMILEQHQYHQKSFIHQWQKKLQRLEYESNLARRRYEAVDPENRLVASTLEMESGSVKPRNRRKASILNLWLNSLRPMLAPPGF